jgi:hypothetical protein
MHNCEYSKKFYKKLERYMKLLDIWSIIHEEEIFKMEVIVAP